MSRVSAAKPSKLDEYQDRLRALEAERATIEAFLADVSVRIVDAYAAELKVNPHRSFDTHTTPRKLEREKREKTHQLESVNARISALAPIIQAEQARLNAETLEQLTAEAAALRRAEDDAVATFASQLHAVMQAFVSQVVPVQAALAEFGEDHPEVDTQHAVEPLSLEVLSAFTPLLSMTVETEQEAQASSLASAT